jgi:Flp pilus assembly protein TadG
MAQRSGPYAKRASGSDGGRRRANAGTLRGLAGNRRGVAALEFALASTPLLMLVFGFIATNAVFYAWSTMQNNAQYAARLMATGQIANLATGPIGSAANTSTAACSSSLNSTEVEYYACTGLPSWVGFTVTATEDCTVPSVTVSLSANASAAALADVFKIFAGRTLVTQAILMKEGTCP